MCGRYMVTKPPDAIRRLFGTQGVLPNFPPRYNVAPTQDVPVVAMTPCGVSQTQEGGDSKGGCGFMIVMLHPLQTTSIPPLRFLRLNHAPGMFSTAVCVFVGVCRALYLMRLLLVRGADARRD